MRGRRVLEAVFFGVLLATDLLEALDLAVLLLLAVFFRALVLFDFVRLLLFVFLFDGIRAVYHRKTFAGARGPIGSHWQPKHKVSIKAEHSLKAATPENAYRRVWN